MTSLDEYWNKNKTVTAFGEKPPSNDLLDFVYKEYDEAAGLKALDLGCGGGRHSIFLAQHGFQLSSCDLHESMLEETKQRANNNALTIELKKASVINLPYNDDCFDLIISTGVLHNLGTIEEFEKSIREVNRVIKNGVAFFLTIFTNKHISDELQKQNDQGLYKTADSIPMLLLSEVIINDLLVKNGFLEPTIIRKYITQVETGKRSVYTCYTTKK